MIATGFGAGYLPIAPGTWGSLEALLAALLIHLTWPDQERLILAVLVLVLLIPGGMTAERLARQVNKKDPSEVVVDEILGQWVALLWVPLSIWTLAGGFLLFRLLDIIKPFPARQSEALAGGTGIIIDDLIAGFYSGLLLWAVSWLLPIWM